MGSGQNQITRSEASTMNRVCSIFSQLLQLFSRVEFEAAVRQHRAERHARGFTCWGQFVAMLFCQLGRAHSLREICQGLAASEGKLKHLGVPTAPSRSTLAYANQHRPWQLYQTVFLELLDRCQRVAHSGRRKFRFKDKLLSLDATVIDLCARLYDWAKFRRTKGAINCTCYWITRATCPDSRHHGRQNSRVEGRPEAALGAGDGGGVRSWLHRLRLVRGVDPAGSVLGDAAERQQRLCGGGAATGARGRGSGGRGDLLLSAAGRRAGVFLLPGKDLGRRTAASTGVVEQSSSVRCHHFGHDL